MIMRYDMSLFSAGCGESGVLLHETAQTHCLKWFDQGSGQQGQDCHKTSIRSLSRSLFCTAATVFSMCVFLLPLRLRTFVSLRLLIRHE